VDEATKVLGRLRRIGDHGGDDAAHAAACELRELAQRRRGGGASRRRRALAVGGRGTSRGRGRNELTRPESSMHMALAPLLPHAAPYPAAANQGLADSNVLAFANQKGGVAKTTTTLNLGVALRENGLDVLCVDLDPQGNLTMSQGLNPDAIERSMFDVLV
jgi:hypothetical protein